MDAVTERFFTELLLQPAKFLVDLGIGWVNFFVGNCLQGRIKMQRLSLSISWLQLFFDLGVCWVNCVVITCIVIPIGRTFSWFVKQTISLVGR